MFLLDVVGVGNMVQPVILDENGSRGIGSKKKIFERMKAYASQLIIKL